MFISVYILWSSENQTYDLYLANGGRHFEYLVIFLFVLKSQKKSPISLQIVQIFFKINNFQQNNHYKCNLR